MMASGAFIHGSNPCRTGVLNRRLRLNKAVSYGKHTFSIGMMALALIGCSRPPANLLELKYSVTPREVTGPALGGSLPFYFWNFQLPEESPKQSYKINLELRSPGKDVVSICEFSPEYLSTRNGKDLIVSINRAGRDAGKTLADNQFQLRLLDEKGEATAISANNNNCPQDRGRETLNSEFQFPKTSFQSATIPTEAKLLEIKDKQGKVLGDVVLTVEVNK